MKITKLTLERYGAIAERRIPIAPDIGLTIIYGANEAGKSSSLEAIGDFLFGIPLRSTRGQIYGNPAIRIGADLLAANGSIWQMTRAKRNAKSLTFADGSAADTALAAMLGAMTRDRYERLFGLDHESLRAGGDQMLAADGEIGRLIVEAGGGLRDLVGRLENLESQALALFSSTKSAKRAFYQHLDRFQEADKAAKAASLTLEHYQQAQKAVTRAAQDLAGYRKERDDLQSHAAKLQRIARVIPVLRLWDQTAATLADYADVAELPADFASRIRAAMAERATAAAALQSATDRRDQYQARRNALKINADISAAAAEIQALHERALHIVKARADRPNRLMELEEGAAKLANLRALLGLAPEADLLALLPDQAALEHVRALAEQKLSLTPDLQAAEERAADYRREVGLLDARLKAAIAAGQDRAPEASAALFGSVVSQQAALAARAATLATGEAALAQQVSDLGFHSITELQALLVPDEEHLRIEIKAVEQLQNDRAVEAKAQRNAAQSMADAARQAEELQRSGPIASDENIADARQSRAALWGALKQAYVTGAAPENLTDRLAQADQLDGAITAADSLADRRAAEAERAAHLAQAQRRAAEAEADALKAAQEMAALDEQLHARQMSWSQSFIALHARAPELPAALAFVQARQAALTEHQRLRDLAADLASQEAQIAPLLNQLQHLEASYALPAGADFAQRVSAVQQAITARETAYADYRRDLADHEEKSAALERAEARLSQLQQADSEWQAAWPAATKALGLSADISPQVANVAVTEWSSAAGLLGAISLTQQRLARMDEDEAALVADASSLAARLGLALGDDSIAAIHRMSELARENSAQKQQWDTLSPDVEAAQLAVSQMEGALAAVQERLARYAALWGLSAKDEAALEQAAARSAARDEALSHLAEIEQRACAAGDQQDMASLRAECEDRDLDPVTAELSGLQIRQAEQDAAIEASILAEKSARDTLAQYASQSDVNHGIAEREAAAAEMHLALERHLELSLASEMIRKAMAKIRAEQQSPLIAKAGQYFASMTMGEFRGVDADVDDNGNPVVVGCRANDERVMVDQMSDGTRDQLFLAFRLASIENYAAAAEPLPFIADDILVHFDDDRSAATLEILAEVGQQQQILLFTHHQAVRDRAASLAASGRAQIIELDRRA